MGPGHFTEELGQNLQRSCLSPCDSNHLNCSWVLAQEEASAGVLAQVTESKAIVEGKQPRNLRIMNELWSHPPGSNRRPADYEEYSPAPNAPLGPYGSA